MTRKTIDSCHRETMTSVNSTNPCAVCGGDHKCSTGDGGLIICGRADGPVDGYVHLGPAKGDPQFHLYRGAENPPPNDSASDQNGPPSDWEGIARMHAGQLTPPLKAELAAILALPESAIDLLWLVGYRPAEGCWTFRESDHAGVAVGILRRFRDGRKAAMPGGRRGLTLPARWPVTVQAIFAVEGPSDTMAMAAAGLAAVGRPSNTGGVEHLAALLGPVLGDCPVVIVGENDQKPDGQWPGRDGAERVAAGLAGRLDRPVGWALPPDAAKDVRAWLTSSTAGQLDWADRGARLCDRLLADVRRPGVATRTVIRITTVEHAVNERAAAALAGVPSVYQRGGRLVRVVDDPAPPALAIRRPAAPRIEPLTAAVLRHLLTLAAEWRQTVQRSGEPKATAPAHPPQWAVDAVRGLGEWPGVRPLEAVIGHPVFLGDGTVLTAPGYHAGTGLLYRPAPGLEVAVPDRPSLGDAQAALRRLLEVVYDFPFAHAVYQSAWLALVLTPLARFAFRGPSPLFLIDSNTPGSGKGLLADTAARIVTGERATVCPYTADREELRKRITSLAVQGDRLVLLDNLDGPLGNGVLDAALTATTWQDRLLGSNATCQVPLYVTWVATGNNVQLVGDTARRTCHVRLDSPLERPEERSGFRHPDLLGWVGAGRTGLLTDALTVLRAWHAAGRMDCGLTAWGSFEGWSGVVRNALVWCGMPDPAATRVELRRRSEPAAAATAALLEALQHLTPAQTGLTAAEIIALTEQEGPPVSRWQAVLKDALAELLPRPTAQALGYKLRGLQNRIVGGRYISPAGAKGEHGNRWVIIAAPDIASRPADG